MKDEILRFANRVFHNKILENLQSMPQEISIKANFWREGWPGFPQKWVYFFLHFVSSNYLDQTRLLIEII